MNSNTNTLSHSTTSKLTKSLILTAAIVVIIAQANLARGQTSGPTKTAPVTHIVTSWSKGLSVQDVKLVKQVTHGKSDEDRWMIWVAIVRNREASRDIYLGETLTDDKVLANVRVRMTTDETKRWHNTQSHLTATDQQEIVSVLRDDLASKH